MRIGLDIGSTTIKCVVLNENNQIIYKSYERHYSKIIEKTIDILRELLNNVEGVSNSKIAISGSAAMGLCEFCGLSFIQEVYATRVSIKKFFPKTDVVIELGGEDAKILYLSDTMEVRMNGSCAGGTGAFIDQMATLLNVPIDELNRLAKDHEKIYTIASRCGVFAKSDIQPLLNQGARKNDIAASIFYAVVNQTIAGLSQGREIKGNVVYLGGPLTFIDELRKSFDNTLKTKGICPENSLYYVALGAALSAEKSINFNETINKIENYKAKRVDFSYNQPLFKTQEEYKDFSKRHAQNSIKFTDMNSYNGKVYVGVDAGSTTVKMVCIGENGELLYSKYSANSGNPVPIVKSFLEDFYKEYPSVKVQSSAVTGYGEDIIKNAFGIDYGIVETVAHLKAAQKFMPEVDFVIDIGGQDIKCFKIHNGVVDNIFLNEACSSGCGSFLQTFANALGYSINEFANLGLFAEHPVDLGSRCTVFMNSSVKQAQKDGATIEDISAGLSLSVVKNAIYKVIRASSPDELGKNIVVQGGTFLNDAVLRAFETEMGVNVIRPNISGLMGAYGAALYAKAKADKQSTLIKKADLEKFEHNIKIANCGLCSNNCKLTVNTFSNNKKFIGGNRCERPVSKKRSSDELNMYQYKLSLLKGYMNTKGYKNITIGIPMGLNMYELLPFWSRFFNVLGFSVKTSPISSRSLYLDGQHTIPSDTVCFPAKLMHGHIQSLINDKDVDAIFYPCMSYNIDEGASDNHYNCPVVAYYPDLIAANIEDVHKLTYINDYVGIHRKRDFPKKMYEILKKYFKDIDKKQVKLAASLAYNEYDLYFRKVRLKGEEIIKKAREQGKDIIVLSGRPYHIDPEINHGIDKLISSYDVAIVTEDAVSFKVNEVTTTVLNQWTYHSRLYRAAKYVSTQDDMNLVQLVSFGCGVDAITTDEVRQILESNGKIYTQIKIDEITNLGAVKIRLRSLLAAIDHKDKTLV